MAEYRATIGVMGGAANSLSEGELSRLQPLVETLGRVIAARNCILVTGETSGIPGQVAQAASRHGALTVGISPAHSQEEHLGHYGMPVRSSDVVIYTGFGLKGRNVINIRSSEVVVIFCGSIGTLNEFTIAYDEGKIIGVLEGSGGVADLLRGIVEALAKKTAALVIYEREPEVLIDKCLTALETRTKKRKTIVPS